MSKLISINKLKSMIQEKKDLIRFYKDKISEYKYDLKNLENALKSRTIKTDSNKEPKVYIEAAENMTKDGVKAIEKICETEPESTLLTGSTKGKTPYNDVTDK